MAKRFRFRFETMLKARRQREDQHKRIVGRRLREIAATREELARIRRLESDGIESVRAVQQAGRIDPHQAVSYRAWVAHLHRSALDVQTRMAGLEARLAQERADLAEAAKQRRILEKLKERQWERHRLDEQRAETRASDDLNTVRYVFHGIDLGA